MKKFITTICALIILCAAAAGCGVRPVQAEPAPEESLIQTAGRVLPYRFADREEGMEFLMACEAYYDGFSANDLAYRMQRRDADMEDYKAFAREQVCGFTDAEKALIDVYMQKIEQKIADNGYHLPELDEIVFICTTEKEECGASAYTHGTQIYLGKELLDSFVGTGGYAPNLEYLLAHEIFHCLTRSSPGFRADMYRIIHFTVQEEEFEIPPSVMEYYISNPDVEHHNAYAGFIINGEPVNCFIALVTRKHFENAGESFFDTATAALVPVDGTDAYYYPEDASNYDDIFGRNTDYTIDPEECMADNFGFLIAFGAEGPRGDGYRTPEIIDAIREYLRDGTGSE